MSSRIWAGRVLAVGGLLGLVACSGPGGDASRTASAESPATTPAPVTGGGLAGPVKGDAQALGVLQALDENEIDLANAALERDIGGSTATFAQTMAQRHGESLARTRELSPQQSEQSNAVRARGQARAASLKLEDDLNSYRNAFLASANADYADALRTIDAELLPAVQGDAARAHVQEVRRLFAEGYERAQAAASTR
ncbi:MAG TPA: hypothetical protein VGC74_08485 [Stenotrophomonas sp.]|jgi:hypothetical protein